MLATIQSHLLQGECWGRFMHCNAVDMEVYREIKKINDSNGVRIWLIRHNSKCMDPITQPNPIIEEVVIFFRELMHC